MAELAEFAELMPTGARVSIRVVSDDAFLVSGSASYDFKCSDLAEIIGKLGEVILPSGFSGLRRYGHGKALDIETESLRFRSVRWD